MTAVTLTLSSDTIRATLACLDAVATDRREPERYREWYTAAAVEFRAAVSNARSGDDDG